MESNARFILVQNRTRAPVDVFVIDQGRSRTCAESRIQSGQRKRLRVCAYYSVLGWGAAPEDQLTVGLGRVYDISWKGRLAVEEVFLE